MITIVPYRPEHAMSIIDERNGSFLLHKDERATDDTALTAFYYNDVLCCAGIKILWEGVGEVWALTGETARKHPIALHKLVKKWLAILYKKYNLVRMQATVVADEPSYNKWVESLGFENEGLMKKYFLGKDFYRYGRFK